MILNIFQKGIGDQNFMSIIESFNVPKVRLASNKWNEQTSLAYSIDPFDEFFNGHFSAHMVKVGRRFSDQ